MDLTVDEPEAPTLKLGDQSDQGNLGCAVLQGEHALTGKQPSDSHTVQSADQGSIKSDLYGVGMTQLVEVLVGSPHVLGDPGTVLSGSRDALAGRDYRREVCVHAQLEG